jgi:NADPH:quinone reductase-like Zn-dependent oxidoreductase
MSSIQPTESMMALRAHSRGGPEVLVYESAPKPPMGPEQVLVAVDAAAITFTELNWDETWSRDGRSRLPIIPAHEFSGVVADVGNDVHEWRVGDHVFGLVPFDIDGAAAQWLSIDAAILARTPQSVGSAEVAALPLAALTAWQGLLDHGQLERGQRVLIHGAAGGVGIFAVQLAHHFGAQVTVTARAGDAPFLRELGADHIIDFETELFEIHGPVFDLVFDPIGGDVLDRSFEVVRAGGKLITLNAPPSAERAAEYGIDASFFIVSPNPAELSEIANLVDRGELRSIVAATFPLSEGRSAYESGAQHSRAPGKTVLLVRLPQRRHAAE